MTNEQILSRVIALLTPMSDNEEIHADSELIEDLGISSMDVLFLLSSLEEEFNVKVPESEIRKMVTVGDIADCICQCLS